MGFDNLKKRGEEKGMKSSSSFLKVNMYENAQMALDLIAHICTSAVDIDVSSCSTEYDALVLKMQDKLKAVEAQFVNDNFIRDTLQVGSEMCSFLKNNVTSNLNIAVAGGFSAGKSSLLNTITGIGELLPTDIEPMSMINTFINCSSGNKRLVVRGINHRDESVLLNEDVLALAQHSSSTKVYVSSVLKKIILDIPVPQVLDGITFIDTPGYNNSDSVSAGISETDNEKAFSAINEADALFWCIESSVGTITSSDIQFIRDVLDNKPDIPIVVFFTKIDKKGAEIEEIMTHSAELAESAFGHNLVDVCGISREKGVRFRSLHGLSSLAEIVEIVRDQVGETDYFQKACIKLDALFNVESSASSDVIRSIERKRKESIDRKNKLQKDFNVRKQEFEDREKTIKEIIIDSYNEVYSGAQRYYDAFVDAIFGWSSALKREKEWEKKKSAFASISELQGEYLKAESDLRKLRQRDLSFDFYPQTDRDTVYKKILNSFSETLKYIKMAREDEDSNYNQHLDEKKKETEVKHIIDEYLSLLKGALRTASNTCIEKVMSRNLELQGIDSVVDTDIFSAIIGDNWKRFLSCCSHGVDLTECNANGYSPITLACKQGNNEMIKYFIKHDVDLNRKDNRGYNALETAVMCHYQDICELLIKHDKTLVCRCDSLVEIATKNSFVEWISNFV